MPKKRSDHSKREQILDQILLFLVSKVQAETRIVVVDDLVQVLESAIVEEASLLMREEASQGCRTIATVRGALCLERINADLLASVHIPARLGPEWFHVTAVAASFPPEDFVPAFGGFRIEVLARFRFRCGQ